MFEMNPHYLCSPGKGLFCIIIKYRLLFTFFVTHPIHDWTEETNTLWISVISNQQLWHLQSDLSLWSNRDFECLDPRDVKCALLCLEPTTVECYRTQTWGLFFLFARRLSSSTELSFWRSTIYCFTVLFFPQLTFKWLLQLLQRRLDCIFVTLCSCSEYPADFTLSVKGR